MYIIALVVGLAAAPPSPASSGGADDEAAARGEVEALEAAQRAADVEAARKADEEARRHAEQKSLEARGLQAHVRALCDMVAIGLKRLPGDHRLQRFAVVPFANVGGDAEERQLGLVVSDLVVTNLARDHRLDLVERAALARILDEQALGQIGALADGQAAEVGRVSGARALILGNVIDDGTTSYRVSLRAVDVETASVVAGTAHDILVPKDELVAFSTDAVVLRSRSGAMFRSLVVPGWGQAYNDEPVKAGVIGASVGTLAAATIATAGVGGYLRFVLYDQIGTRPEDKGLDPAVLERRVVETREAGDAALIAASVLAGVTAAVWSVNVVDAYLSGTDAQ